MDKHASLLQFLNIHDITISSLAEDTDVSVSLLSRITRGHRIPSKRTIDKIIAVCRRRDPTVTYEDLFEEVT